MKRLLLIALLFAPIAHSGELPSWRPQTTRVMHWPKPSWKLVREAAGKSPDELFRILFPVPQGGNMHYIDWTAGEDLTIKVSRDGVNDTNNDLAKMLHAEVT